MTELDREEHADRVALDGLNSDQVNYSVAYQSMMVKYTSRQDQPTKKRMRTHETCSTAMRLDQINAVHQANCEHLVGKSNTNLPEAMTLNHFVMPFIVSDGSLHTAGAGLNEFVLITHISKCLQVGTYSVLTNRYLPLAKPSTYLATTKLGRTQQYTLLIAITLAMSSAP